MEKGSKWDKFVNFLCLMKLDFCLLLFGIANAMQNVTVVQLSEDKLCINQLELPVDYCLTLTEKHNSEADAQIVLKHADDIRNWQFFIMNIPGTVISGFLGYWLDKYPGYLKFMILLTLAAETLQSIILIANAFAFEITSYAILIAYVPFALGGGMFLIYGACYTYVAWSTPPELLTIRFAIMEFVNMSASLIGTYISGQILIMEPWFEGQPRNYIGVLVLSASLLITSLVFCILFKLKNMPKCSDNDKRLGFFQVLTDVFQFSRFKDLFQTFFKRRPNQGRARLLLLVISGTLCLGAMHGEETINYQFAQRVYGWSAEKFSTLLSLLSIIPAVSTSIAPQFLKICLRLPDPIIGLLGSASIFTMNLIHGLVLTPTGFSLTYITGAFNRVSFVAFRSLISTMVDSFEAAKIFTLITVFDSYGALASAFLYTRIFNATIRDDPGLAFVVAACILLIPVATCLWLEITRGRWQTERKEEKVNIYGDNKPKPVSDSDKHVVTIGINAEKF